MNLLPVSEVARRLSCSTTQVYRLLNEGFLEEYQSGRWHFVTSQSLQRFIETHEHDGRVDVSINYARLVRDNPQLVNQRHKDET